MGLDMYLNAVIRPAPDDLPANGKGYWPNWDHTPPEQRADYRRVLEAVGLTTLATDNTSAQLERPTVGDVDGWLTEGPATGLAVTVAKWRKANAIHAWFVAHCQDGVDDCGSYPVHFEQLAELRSTALAALEAVKQGDPEAATALLPPQAGFFFGSTELDEDYADDLRHTVACIERIVTTAAREHLTLTLEYQASW